MSAHSNEKGFTAAELLITLFIGTVFLIAGYQLYLTVIEQSTYAHKYAKASAAAQAYMNRQVNNAELMPTNCPSLPQTNSYSFAFYGQDYFNYTFTISCPNPTELPDLRKFSVKATKDGGVVATRATYYSEP